MNEALLFFNKLKIKISLIFSSLYLLILSYFYYPKLSQNFKLIKIC